MKSIRLRENSDLLHIEAPGCIVNINPGLIGSQGHKVCRVDITADGNRYMGDPQWWIDGEAGNTGLGVRVIQTDTPAPAKHAALATASDLAAAVRIVLAAVQEHDKSLNDPHGDGSGVDAESPTGDDYNEVCGLLQPLYDALGMTGPLSPPEPTGMDKG